MPSYSKQKPMEIIPLPSHFSRYSRAFIPPPPPPPSFLPSHKDSKICLDWQRRKGMQGANRRILQAQLYYIKAQLHLTLGLQDFVFHLTLCASALCNVRKQIMAVDREIAFNSRSHFSSTRRYMKPHSIRDCRESWSRGPVMYNLQSTEVTAKYKT